MVRQADGFTSQPEFSGPFCCGRLRLCTHSSTLAWKIPRTEEPGGLPVHGVAKSWTRLSDFTFTFHFHTLEKEMETHSSVLAWRIPGTGEPGGLPSMGSHRVGHNWSNLAAAAVLWLQWEMWIKNEKEILYFSLSSKIHLIQTDFSPV